MSPPTLSRASIVAQLVSQGVPQARAESVADEQCGPAVKSVPVKRGAMNKTEARRAAELEVLRKQGLIDSWAFEAVTLKLADRVRYTPDFFVVDCIGLMWFEEVKGFMRDDARIKLQVAAKQFPMFAFFLMRSQKGGGWERKVIAP